MRISPRVIIVAIVLFLAIVVIGRRAFAGESVSFPEIGAHIPLLKFEKNENPQNLMIVYTKLNPESCSFAGGASGPVLDEYWLISGKTFKKVHPLIKQGVAERLEVDRGAFKNSQRFLVHLKDFQELKSDLGPSPTFEVKAKKKGVDCDAVVEMQLGPSDHHRKIEIWSIYADSSKKLAPPFRTLRSVTLNGKDLATGEIVRRTYSAN